MLYRMISVALLLASLFGCAQTASDTNYEPSVVGSLSANRLKEVYSICNVPALGVAIVENGELVDVNVIGVRKHDSGVLVSADNMWNIGSNTKSMTATLIARLVEKKLLSWDTSMREAFPKCKNKIHPEFAEVTITQLLNHSSGIRREFSLWELWHSDESLSSRRKKLAISVLSSKPEYKPGTGTNYSNVGYVIAGSIAENITGIPFEELLGKEVFQPLGISQFGFGAPCCEELSLISSLLGSSDNIDQPYGHTSIFGYKHSWEGPLSSVYWPAGGVYISLRDWAFYAIEHLKGESGTSKFLSKKSYMYLHHNFGEDYALGWGNATIQENDTVYNVVYHGGSNRAWNAYIALSLNNGYGILIVTNEGTSSAKDAIIKLRDKLVSIQIE